MPQDAYHVTDAEFAVLETLWDEGAATIRVIADRLYPDGRSSDYATVQKLLDRLEAKGCVTRDRSSFAHVFRTAVKREELLGQELRGVATKLCDGSLTPLLMHLVQGAELSEDDRAALRRLLDEPGGAA